MTFSSKFLFHLISISLSIGGYCNWWYFPRTQNLPILRPYCTYIFTSFQLDQQKDRNDHFRTLWKWITYVEIAMVGKWFGIFTVLRLRGMLYQSQIQLLRNGGKIWSNQNFRQIIVIITSPKMVTLQTFTYFFRNSTYKRTSLEHCKFCWNSFRFELNSTIELGI